MGAIIKDLSKRWNRVVPYVVDGGCAVTNLLEKINDFNSKVGEIVFVPRKDEKDFVEFKNGANSPIGKQGGKQECRVENSNLYHEMGHAIGLGHTYFHSESQLPALFRGLDADAYNTAKTKYQDTGAADETGSMMGYRPMSFVNSSPIKTIVEWKGFDKATHKCLTTVRKNVEDDRELSETKKRELLSDIDRLIKYWTFDDGFMERLTSADIANARKVLGL